MPRLHNGHRCTHMTSIRVNMFNNTFLMDTKMYTHEHLLLIYSIISSPLYSELQKYHLKQSNVLH